GKQRSAKNRAGIKNQEKGVRRPGGGTSVSPAGAARTRQFASPRDILRPFAERYRFPPRAAFPRWYRRTARSLEFRPRSAAGSGGAPLLPNGLPLRPPRRLPR